MWQKSAKEVAFMFRESLEELKKTRTITICGLFAAMSCLMGSFTIRIGNILKIGFSGLINELVSMFFGPVVGGVFGVYRRAR